MDYQKIDELLLKIKSAYESIGAETELVVEEPASIAEVESIENIIESFLYTLNKGVDQRKYLK